jgi:hypothetical protein
MIEGLQGTSPAPTQILTLDKLRLFMSISTGAMASEVGA